LARSLLPSDKARDKVSDGYPQANVAAICQWNAQKMNKPGDQWRFLYAHKLPEPIRKFTRSIQDAEHLSFIQGGGE
jgi:hypothetical protein